METVSELGDRLLLHRRHGAGGLGCDTDDPGRTGIVESAGTGIFYGDRAFQESDLVTDIHLGEEVEGKVIAVVDSHHACGVRARPGNR